MTRHCHQCGCEFRLNGNPGRLETCLKCGADLKVCLNCLHYDRTVAEQCKERRADLVQEKHMANFCEYFDMKKGVWAGGGADLREETARDRLKKLFGD